MLTPFHLAITVHDLPSAREFYGSLFGCPEGRSSHDWVDFDFFGHQLVAHVDSSRQAFRPSPNTNKVDGKDVPVPHFGVVLEWRQWHALVERLKKAKVDFVIEPCVRFPGEVGEQATFFLYDRSGNALEFKTFRDPCHLFAK